MALDYLDEDWGWYVFSVRQETPKDETNEICVYAYPEEGGRQLNDDGAWMLIVHTRFKVPWMQFFKRWRGGAFNRSLGTDLLRSLQALGTRNIKSTEMLLDSAGNMSLLKEFDPGS